MNKNNETNILEGQEIINRLEMRDFVDFIIHRLYILTGANHIPQNIRGIFDEKTTEKFLHINTIEDIRECIISYISDKCISDLNELFELFLKAYKPNKKGTDGTIDKQIIDIAGKIKEKVGVIKYKNLLKSQEVTTVSDEIKTEIKQTIENTSESDLQNLNGEKSIHVKKGIIDFNTWDNIFNNYINGFNKITHTKGFRTPEKIKDFINSLKEENRGKRTVFLYPIDFIKEFKFIEFYSYLINYLNAGKYKKELAQGIIENLPKFEIEGTIRIFTDLQENVFKNAGDCKINCVNREIGN